MKLLKTFFQLEAASGILLALCAVVAIALANSRVAALYHAFWQIKVLGFLDLHRLVNDGLMTIFFFVVGMEIKRELVTGELSSPKRAALPLVAALGGMLAPALIYYFLNPNYPESKAGEFLWLQILLLP